MNEPKKHSPKLVKCPRHGYRLTRSCQQCRSLGLNEEQWTRRESLEVGEVFSVELCRFHGNPKDLCPACVPSNLARKGAV